MGFSEGIAPDGRVFDGASFVVVHGAGRDESSHAFRAGKVEFDQVVRQRVAAGFGGPDHFFHDAADTGDVFRVFVEFRDADAPQRQAEPVERYVPDELVPLDLFRVVKGACLDARPGKESGKFLRLCGALR